MPLLPKGTRVGDPELHGRAALRFRLALAARKYPIQLAMVIMLVIVSYPVWLLVTASNRIEAAQRDLKTVVVTTTTSRQTSSRGYCDAINDNARGLNGLTDYFIGLVQKNIEDEKPKGEELAEAKIFVSGLREKKIKPLDCAVFQARIEEDIAKLQASGS